MNMDSYIQQKEGAIRRGLKNLFSEITTVLPFVDGNADVLFLLFSLQDDQMDILSLKKTHRTALAQLCRL